MTDQNHPFGVAQQPATCDDLGTMIHDYDFGVGAAPANSSAETAQAWCQPMDNGKHTPRKFMLYFEDADHGPAVFDNEGEAREAFTKANTNWNCYLFGALPLSSALPQTSAEILEASEDLAGHQMVTVRSNRGDEYVIDADAAVKSLAQLFSDYDNEQRFGWTLSASWFEQELAKLRASSLSRPESK